MLGHTMLWAALVLLGCAGRAHPHRRLRTPQPTPSQWQAQAALHLTRTSPSPSSAGPQPHVVPYPNTTLLPPNTTSFVLHLNTSAATACRYSLLTRRPFAAMTPFATTGGVLHSTTVRLPPPNATAAAHGVTAAFLACAAWPDEAVTAYYRVLADTNPDYPRTGNLWGTSNFRGRLEHASHIDLWLGADWTVDEVDALRAFNRHTMVLGSINAVEYGDGLPDRYYLHNISGSRCEVWPGAYRLDLTKPFVSAFKAQLMFNEMLHGGGEGHPASGNVTMYFDGMFVDNVFLTQSWLKHDIHGNPFYPDTNGSGKPADPKELDREWRAGVLLELSLFRQMMPHALMSGHAMDYTDAAVAAIFNGISIGFAVPEVVEGHEPFAKAWAQYEGWEGVPRHPHITMMESAPPLQLGYGYGYDTQLSRGSIPPSTLNFSATYFHYMRYGLALTLMRDGYFAHELGDSWHGQDWWYDELDVPLGQPLAGPEHADVRSGGGQGAAAGAVGLPRNWTLWVDAQGNASLAWDAADKRSATASARVTIARAPPRLDGVDLHVDGVPVIGGQRYTLSFWAKSSVEGAYTIEADARVDHANWDPLGIDQRQTISAQWAAYSLPFQGAETTDAGRLSFYLAPDFASVRAGTTVWVDNVTLAFAPPPVFQRRFTHGLALLNGDSVGHTVEVPPGYARLKGAQAPRDQLLIDDNATAFAVVSGAWATVQFEGGYDLAHPSSEQLAAHYFHQWAVSARQAAGKATARWRTSGVTCGAASTYTVKVWWPALPNRTALWSASVSYAIVDGSGKEVASTVLDQTQGGDVWVTAFEGASLSTTSTIEVRCDGADGRVCVADAVLVESAQRYNDGSPASGPLHLSPMDGIVLVPQP